MQTLNSEKKILNMTEGGVFSVLMRFALPIMLGNIFQDIYSLVDMTVAGYVIGDEAIAAIASTDSISTITNYSCSGFGIGCAVLMSQAFGAGDMKRLRQAFCTMAILSAGLSAVTIASFMGLLEPFLSFMNVPDALRAQAHDYIFIIIMFQFATQFYNMYAAAFRALGNSKAPLVFLIICSGLNIVLDIIFMAVFNWGVKGAAAATVASQGLSALMSAVWFARSYPELRSGREFFKNCTLTKEMLPMGLSVMATNCLFAVGALAVQGSANSLGQSCIVGHGAAKKIWRFAFVPSVGIANACSTFAAQNYGAGKLDRIRLGVRKAVLFSFLCNIATFSVLFVLGGRLIKLVTNTESSEVIEAGVFALRTVVPFIFTQTITMGYRMNIMAMKRKIVPMIGTGIELFTRCGCAWGLTPVIGYTAICISEPVSWVVSGIVMYICFISIWKKEKAASLAVK